MKEKLYDIVRAVVRPIYGFLFGRRVFGVENLPQSGGFVLCANHLHARDPFYIAAALPKNRRLFSLAKKELFANKIVGGFLSDIGAIPIDRGNADLSAMRTAFKVVREGNGLIVFPQGTRSRDNSPTPFLTGASMIALRCGVSVIPAYIGGPYRLFVKTDIFLGKPLDFSDLGTRIDANVMTAATRRIEDAVWNLKKV